MEVLDVSRADAKILRNYPDSPFDFPYYEVRVRVVNTWGGYSGPECGFTIENPYRLANGKVIRLLWTPRRKVVFLGEREQDLERLRRMQIWKGGGRYLLFGVRGVALDEPAPKQLTPQDPRVFSFDSVESYQKYLREGGRPSPPVEDILFLVGEYLFDASMWECGSPSSIVSYAGSVPLDRYIRINAGASPLICDYVPYGVLPDPPKEVLQLLDEESVVLRLADPASRCAWAKQRAQDKNLPIWKRQRMVLYFLNQCLRCGSTEPPDAVLAWLGSLEPEVRAFGLQTFLASARFAWVPDLKERAQHHQRFLAKLEEFLDVRQPATVRREAAWVFAERLSDILNDLDPADRLAWRERLEARVHEEEDVVVRRLLELAVFKAQMKECLQRIWALERQLDEMSKQGAELRQR